MHCPINVILFITNKHKQSFNHLRIQGMQFVRTCSKFVGTSMVNFCLQGTRIYIKINIKILTLHIHYCFHNTTSNKKHFNEQLCRNDNGLKTTGTR